MRVLDIIRRAGRSLKQAKTRTLLTSLAIGVGAFTITLSLAGGQGGRDYADAIVRSNTDTREVAVFKESGQANDIREYNPGSAGSAVQGSNLVQISANELEDIRKLDNVSQVTPGYSPSVNYVTREGQKKFVVSSVSTFSPNVTLEFAAGAVDGDLKDNEIILNEDYAKVLGFSSPGEAVGKTVQLNATKQRTAFGGVAEAQDFSYVVRAVSSESGLAFRSQGSLLISTNAAASLYDYISEGTPGYNTFVVASVLVDKPENAQSVKQSLQDKGYTAQTSEDILGTVNTFINVLLGILLGFGALAVLTSIFGIVNTQYISVLERTQQIGLMKALGMSRGDVGRLFTFEAAWIGFLGGAIGAGLAVVAGTIANPLISEALSLGDISLLIFVPTQVIGVIVTLVLIAIAAGYFPSRRAAKLDPIEALRTE